MPIRVVSTPHPRRSAWWLAAACTAAIGYFTLLPAPGEPGTAFFCLICGSRGGVDAVLNLLLFVPLGIALALAGVRPTRAIIAMSILSACIEATQFIALPGRDATLGDIVMNTAGGAIGVAMTYWASAWLRPSPRFAARACVAWSALWLGAQAVASFALAPLLPRVPYYGQIARAFASMATFPGTVLDARVAATSIPDRRIPDELHIRAPLAMGAPISAVVVPGRETARLAPIVRIADRRREEVAILGQDVRTFVFGVRTGAAALRLRPPLFALPDVFADSQDTAAADPQPAVRLDARYGAMVSLRAERPGTSVARDVPVVAGLGWTLVLPQQWYIEGTVVEATITALWLAAGLFPLGLWAGGLRRRRAALAPTRDAVVITVLLGAVLACGLAVIPLRFGLAPARLTDWLGAVGGIVAGFTVARAIRGQQIPAR